MADDYNRDYLTDVITQKAPQFLDRHSSEVAASPFLILSTPALHTPPTPAPQQKFANVFALRTPAFNHVVDDLERKKHWLLRRDPKPMPKTR